MTEDKAKPAKQPAKETIYVDIEDDITAIIGKVEASKSGLVALVLPKRSTTLQSIVNMRLLKRSADSAEKKIVLITSESALLPLAGAAGLHVAKNLHSAPEIPEGPDKASAAKEQVAKHDDEEPDEKAKIDYKKPIGVLAAGAALHDDDDEAIDLKDTQAEAPEKPAKKLSLPKNKKLKIPNFDLFRTRLGLVITGIVALFLFFIIGGKVLPKATITLQTTSDPVSASVNLTTSDKAKKLDLKSNTIPAALKSTNQSSNQQVTATGTKNLGKKASGNVTFSIACSDVSGSPPTIAAGTGIKSTDNLFYITQSDASVTNPDFNGGCHFTGSTTIVAQSPGSQYNVSSASFSVPGQPNVSGSGSASGGSDNNVTVLSQSDVDAAVKKLTDSSTAKDLTDKLKKDLQDQGYYVLDSTLKAGKAQVTATPAVGQQASSSSISIKVPYTVLVVKKADLSQAVTAALNKQIDTAHQKLSTDDVLKDADVTVQGQTSPTVVGLSVTEQAVAVPQLDEASVKKDIAGKKAGDIKAALSNLPGIKNVDVNFSPFWVSKAPTSPGKIHIVLQPIITTDQNNQNNNNQQNNGQTP